MDDPLFAEIQAILENYTIGYLVEFERNNRGYVNTSYAIRVESGGRILPYFLRKYKPGIREPELQFEHSLIERLVSGGFQLVARVIPTREGATFVSRAEGNAGGDDVYYAIFEYLPGEDRYTWIAPRCSREEIIGSASVLARFHELVFGFSPAGSRQEAKMLDLLPTIPETALGCLSRSRGNAFERYLHNHLHHIQMCVGTTLDSLHRLGCSEILQLVIHCDYHPGNLKFEGNQIVGLFDFDWSKIDYRCFDVALAIFYNFCSWDGKKDGAVRLDEMDIFLSAYQKSLNKPAGPGALVSQELECLAHMIGAANLYVLNWTLYDYLQKEVDPQQYLRFLRHAVNTIRWLDAPRNAEILRETSMNQAQ